MLTRTSSPLMPLCHVALLSVPRLIIANMQGHCVLFEYDEEGVAVNLTYL